MQDVQDEPLFCHRVAGLDIAKAGVEVTIRVPSDATAGRPQQETRSFGTTRAELESLGDWLACWGVTRIGMEATGVTGSRCSSCWKHAGSTASCTTPRRSRRCRAGPRRQWRGHGPAPVSEVVMGRAGHAHMVAPGRYGVSVS